MKYRKRKHDAREEYAPSGIDSAEPILQPLLIIGAGDLLHDIISLIRENPVFSIAGILDPNPQLARQSINGLPVLGWLDDLRPGRYSAVIGNPSSPDGFDRASVFHIIEKRGIDMPILKSASSACANDAVLRKGALLLAGSSVSPGATLGINCLIASGAHIGRNAVIPDHTAIRDGESFLLNRSQARPRTTQSLEAATATAGEPITEVIKKLNSSRNDIVLVVGSNGVLNGTVTDGDIRRGILAGINLAAPVSSIMNPAPVSASIGTPIKDMLAIMQEKGIRHLPVVDTRGKPVRLETIKNLVGSRLPNDAVVMAGGLGARLRPLTYSTPKPLLNVAGKPILDHILENIRKSGLHDVAISLNYKAGEIKEHVGRGDRYDLNVDYLSESKRMGTAGALSLIKPRPTRPFLVMNGDLLTHLNFSRLFEFQKRSSHKLVMCVKRHSISIPYGVVNVDRHHVTGIQEKPDHDFFINAGIYVVDPSCIGLIPKDTFFDMPDLITALIQAGSSVGAFPIIEYWRDIGTPEDLRAASVETIFDGTRTLKNKGKNNLARTA